MLTKHYRNTVYLHMCDTCRISWEHHRRCYITEKLSKTPRNAAFETKAAPAIVTYRVIFYQLLCAIGYFCAVIHFIHIKLCMGALIVGHIVRRRIERQGFYGVEPYKCPIKRRSTIVSIRREHGGGCGGVV